MKKKRYKIKQPVDPMGIADKKTRENWINKKGMKAFNFYKYNEMKAIDIIIESPVSYKEAKKDYMRVRSSDITIPVISINKLVKMKKNTKRPIDKIDIKNLKRIKELKRKSES